MKNLGKLAGAIIFVVMLFGASSLMAGGQNPIDKSENPSYLFTISASSGSFENDRVSLNGIPLVVYFSDRPYRKTGHMSLEDFAKIWQQGDNSFAADPPNAELAIYVKSGDTHAVVTISEPEIGDGSISFSVKLLEGDIPATFGHATLFIDCLGLMEPCKTS